MLNRINNAASLVNTLRHRRAFDATKLREFATASRLVNVFSKLPITDIQFLQSLIQSSGDESKLIRIEF